MVEAKKKIEQFSKKLFSFEALPLALFALVILLVYLPGFGAYYFLDDNHTIQNNPFVHQIKNILHFWQSGSSYSVLPANYGYRPLTLLSNIILWWAGDGSPVAFQIFKKLLFVGLVFVFISFLKKILKLQNFLNFKNPTEKNLFVWFCVTVFALHPLHTENLNYISSTSSLLCGFFYLLSLTKYLSNEERPNTLNTVWACVFYFLACMAKEEGITLIAVIVLFEILKKSSFKEMTLKVLPFVAAAAAVIGVLWLKYEPTSNIARGGVSRLFYFMTQWKAYIFYWFQHFLPIYFNADNLEFSFVSSAKDFLAWAMLALNLIIVGAAVAVYKKMPGLLFCVLLFYIGLSPSSSIVPLSEAVNDHRILISASGGVIVVSYLFFKLIMFAKEKIQIPLFFAALAILAGLTFQRNLVWADHVWLQEDTYKKNPSSPRAANNYALEMMAQARYAEAHELLQQCLKLSPTYSVCHVNEAITFKAEGRENEAEESFKKAITYDQFGTTALTNYADFLMARGRFSEAREILKAAISRTKGNNDYLQDKLNKANIFLGEPDLAK